jgi:hypothetical protein
MKAGGGRAWLMLSSGLMRVSWRAAAILGLSCGPAWVLPCGVAMAADPPPSQDSKAAAQEHFTHARELYATGRYQEAMVELEAAKKLDPTAKDLVFNLGFVAEKLGRIDDALTYFHAYQEMDTVTPAEVKRAESYIRRLEGAKRTAPPPPPSASASQEPPPPAPPNEKRPHGRIDGATIAAAAIGVGGLAVGGIFGAKALGDQVSSAPTTSKANPYSGLQSQQDNAHREATIADVGFAIGGVGVLAAAVLFFAREKDKAPLAPKTEIGHMTFTAVDARAHANGATLVVGGEF